MINSTRKWFALKPSCFYQIYPVISDENTSPPQTRFNVFLYILLIERITFTFPQEIGIVNEVIPVSTSLWRLTETSRIQERKYFENNFRWKRPKVAHLSNLRRLIFMESGVVKGANQAVFKRRHGCTSNHFQFQCWCWFGFVYTSTFRSAPSESYFLR